MMSRLWGFFWDHFWKLVSFGVTSGFIWFVSSVQAPSLVQARISNMEVEQVQLKEENLKLRIGLGTNNELFNKIDHRLDRVNESLIRLSEQVSRINK